MGKTRLARRLANTVVPSFADGVRWVELAPVRDEGAVTAAVAAALEVQQRPQRSLADSIVDVLAPRRLLLVLDNCEHVIDTVSELVELVMQWCPEVQVLATSREPLGIPAELVWSVPPLPVPSDADQPLADLAAVPAVQLFVARATAAQADFVLDDGNRRAIAELCIRLDGVPLALELGAARMRSMSAAELAARLPERFRVLAGSRRATDPRHRTLRDLVQWSYDLLTPLEQNLFDRLSVFAGSFVLERAEQVCAGDGIDERDVAGVLGVLVDKSMLVMQRSGSRVRYRLLETLREFGREHLVASPEYRRAAAPPTPPSTPSWPTTRPAGWAAPMRPSGWSRSTPPSTTCARRTAPPSPPATSTTRFGSWSGCASTRGGAFATSCSPGPRRRWRCRAPPSTRSIPSPWPRSATAGSSAVTSTARSRSPRTRWQSRIGSASGPPVWRSG